MALELHAEGADDFRMTCPAPLRCYACGGKPPYTWAVTGNAVLDVKTGLKVKISPPVNTNPGVAGSAYVWAARFCSFGGFNDCVCQTFDCNGVGGACSNVGCASFVSCGGCAGSFAAGCTLFETGTGQGASCDALPNFATACAGLAVLHDTTDLRTPTMKANGCKPCSVEMNGVVVTVTDSLGKSVSKVIKA